MVHAIVVGAGIAGLSAAVSLRRSGHVVSIYERSSMNNEIGAAINVPPNAVRFLTAWGLDPLKWKFVVSRRTTLKDPFTMGDQAQLLRGGMAKDIGGTDLYYAHRVDLHNSLKWMATRPEGPGTPVSIHLKQEVVGYDPLDPSIILEGGRKINGDVIIGADGVHSLAAEAVLGHKLMPIPPVHFNYAYRFLVAAEDLRQDPSTAFWLQDCDGWLRIFADNPSNRRLVSYPCRNNTIHNFVGIFYEDTLNSTAREDWQAGATISDVLDKFSDFHPSLLDVVRKGIDVKKWPLLYRSPTPVWRKGRLVLSGDAAHPMLPHQGQGGAQGLEDGLALGICLHGASSAQDIEDRLDLYIGLRRNRTSAIQILSNVGQDQSHLVRDELSQYMDGDEIPSDPPAIYKFNFGYDIVRESMKAMKEFDSEFGLPMDFFETDVAPVPT